MGDLSNNFNRSEFACRGDNCCDNSSPIHSHLVHCLQSLRNLVSQKLSRDTPLVVSSGFRCIRHNEVVQKKYNKNYVSYSSKSKHCEGIAVDVMCPEGITVDEFALLAEKIHGFKMGGIGKYSNRLHLDIRGEVARWDDR